MLNPYINIFLMDRLGDRDIHALYGITELLGRGLESGLKCWRVSGPALVLFLFYVNVSEMHPRSLLSYQPLTILASWVLLRVRWSISLVPWFHPGWLPPVSLQGIGRLS